MPNYNCEKYLGEAIESILNQTYENFEFIILDDCSTDNSWKIISDYANKDKRIRAYKNDENMGRPKSRNKILNLVDKKSSYYLWMDSDDVLINKCLDVKVNYLEANKNLSGLGSAIEYTDSKLNILFVRKYPKTFGEILKSIFIFSPLSQGGLMLRSNLVKEKYDESYLVCQDYEMWFRLIDNGVRFENLNDVLYKYRQFDGQGKSRKLKLSILNTIKIKSKYIFKIKYLSFYGLIRYFMELFLLLLPKKIVMWLFYKINRK